jgi:DNA-binding CsgD family transcriptional regulator
MTSSSNTHLFAAFGQLAEKLTDNDFWPTVCSFVESECRLDEFAVFHYVWSKAPRRIFDCHSSPDRDRLHGELLQAAYLIGPYYNSIVRAQADSGFYTIDELAPDAFRESEYHRIYYAEKQASDEGMFFVPLEDGVSIGLLAERRKPSEGFSEAEISLMKSMSPCITALVRQRWRLVGASGNQQRMRNQHMVTALECFGRDLLSEREREIAELILRGHSSKSGARELGISPETERVHRKRMYGKLDISSQAELFWLFIQSVRYFNPATHNDPLQVLLAQRD